MTMTSRERILAAINHKEPDRVPIDFGAMRSTGIMAIEYNRLKSYLKHEEGETFVYDLFQQLAEPEEWIIDLFHADVIQLHRLRPAMGYSILNRREGTLPDGSPCTYPAEFLPVKQEGGEAIIENGKVTWFRPESASVFYPEVHPLSGVRSLKEIECFDFEAIDEEEKAYLSKHAKELREGSERAILASFGGNIIEAGESLFGFEEFLTLMATEKPLVHRLFERLTESYIADLDRYIDAIGDNIDIIQLGDDLGSQQAPLVSPKMYRDMIMPYHKEIYQYIKRHSDYKVFLHSCGAIAPLIPDLIEAGVDILNPLQTSASGMDPSWLKNEFGKDLTFWGGSSETQSTLVTGTPQEVKEEAKRRIEIFSPGGGYVFNQVHNILKGIPPANIVALYEAAYE